MIRVTLYLMALAYSFPWTRIPDAVGAVDIPLQRLLGWVCIMLVTMFVARSRVIVARGATRLFLVAIAGLMAAVLVTGYLAYARDPEFHELRFVMELSKYFAVLAIGYTIYLALERGWIDLHKLTRYIMYSAGAAILLSLIYLGLYLVGFTTSSDTFARSFGGLFLGVWPTEGVLPRLAGNTAEPQQFSVAFITGLMLMLSPSRIGRWWPLALLGVIALLLCQSKFALLSVIALWLYMDRLYVRQRWLIRGGALLALPILILIVSSLSVYQATLRQGLEAGAFTERARNILVLVYLIDENPYQGIGAGQYGRHMFSLLSDDPTLDVGYRPGNDALMILAENGLFGFIPVVVLFVYVMWKWRRVARGLPPWRQEIFYAYYLGAASIILNMLIGYEFLHAFFWVNFGVLLYLGESWAERAERRRPAPVATVSPA